MHQFIGFVIAGIALHTRPWLQHLSFNFNLNQIALATFRVGDNIRAAQENIPILGRLLGHVPPAEMAAVEAMMPHMLAIAKASADPARAILLTLIPSSDPSP